MDESSEKPWAILLTTMVTLGAIVLAIYAWKQHEGMRLIVFACGGLLALASLLTGAFIGFIFGIPKTVSAAAASSNQTVETYQGNTNLEQISDWLTKILVGAGLVELGNLGNSFQGLTSKLAAGGCLGNCGQLVAGSVIILYAIAGFGLAYLYARIYLALELRDAGKDRFPIESPLGQMKAALYLNPPEGFQRAINIAQTLMQAEAPITPRFWYYLAAAHGQKASWAKRNNNSEDFLAAKGEALSAARKAIELDAGMKTDLQALWRPQPGSQDDDLAVFADEPEFKTLLT